MVIFVFMYYMCIFSVFVLCICICTQCNLVAWVAWPSNGSCGGGQWWPGISGGTDRFHGLRTGLQFEFNTLKICTSSFCCSLVPLIARLIWENPRNFCIGSKLMLQKLWNWTHCPSGHYVSGYVCVSPSPSPPAWALFSLFLARVPFHQGIAALVIDLLSPLPWETVLLPL